jgi:hypothetical protein
MVVARGPNGAVRRPEKIAAQRRSPEAASAMELCGTSGFERTWQGDFLQ